MKVFMALAHIWGPEQGQSAINIDNLGGLNMEVLKIKSLSK